MQLVTNEILGVVDFYYNAFHQKNKLFNYFLSIQSTTLNLDLIKFLQQLPLCFVLIVCLQKFVIILIKKIRTL